MSIPDYTLRYSKKAKYLQLRLSNKGLHVVIPEKHTYSSEMIEKFIQTKEDWIIKNWQKYLKLQVSSSSIELPTHIHLPAINQVWDIKYEEIKTKKLRLITNLSQQITLIGKREFIQGIQLLKTWLKELAKKILIEELYKLSKETGLYFKSVSIRYNSSRWGSCSSRGHISLCCKLLFLEYSLMKHILLHELCHTRVMNHGPKFWHLLETFDPLAKDHVKRIKIETKNLPQWVK